MQSPIESDLIYFLHIPKTSGISVHNFFLQIFSQESVSPPLLWDHVLTGEFQLNENIRIITGHFGGLLPLWLKRWPKIITMLREPLPRALSHINHVQRDEGHPLHQLATGLSVLQYCEHPILRKTIDNLQSRYLASLSFSQALMPKPQDSPSGPTLGSISVQFENALSSLDRESGLVDAALCALQTIDAVGICEAHRQSLQLFARTLGWGIGPDVIESRLNVAPPDKAVETLSLTEIKALENLTTVDNSVYVRACHMFINKCKDHSISLDRELLDQIAGVSWPLP